MDKHHSRAIEGFLTRYSDLSEFPAVLLAGSLAHGFAKAASDIDIILVATEEEYQVRAAEGKLTFSLWDICDYEGGYVDCKVVSLASLRTIADRGSDPARYAFKDARILSSRIPELETLLSAVTRYPVEQKVLREHRFVSQVLAWKWYLSQAEEKHSAYLTHLSAQKLVLFVCRTLLNRAEALYPYHKWLLAETKKVAAPAGLLDAIDSFLERPTFAQAQAAADLLLGFVGKTERDVDWPNQFMADSELNWLHHEAPVDDL